LKEQWCIPPRANAEFVCAMEDVLEVYHRPYDERRPLACLDEASRQLIGEVARPLPVGPGRPERFDYEYVRNGTANLFLIAEPLVGWRAVQVTDRRTAKDFAEVVRWLVEDVHEEAERVVLVVDNLNTHKPASLYEAFPPGQARRITERVEWHYTPKHGSWLNIAEVELSALARQCLGRRLGTKEELQRAVHAWVRTDSASFSPEGRPSATFAAAQVFAGTDSSRVIQGLVTRSAARRASASARAHSSTPSDTHARCPPPGAGTAPHASSPPGPLGSAP
jgi:hypothetical protein